jgi:acetate kinase
MLILVINCGSSSAKYQLFDIKKHAIMARGLVERISEPASELMHNGVRGSFGRKIACRDHYVAISIILDALIHKKYGVISDKGQIGGIGHRVVHGGEEFKESCLIGGKVIKSPFALRNKGMYKNI